jgi:5'-nucleotidase
MIPVRRVVLGGALALACALGTGAHAHEEQGHSLEQDQHDERAEGLEARRAAQARLTWRDSRWRQDPVVRIKLLGLNDFHGALSRRNVGARPAGGAAVLASYLTAAAAQAEDGAFVIHAGDHVGASPPNSALLQDEPSISFLNMLANEHCRYIGPLSQLPALMQSVLQPRCNVIGTFGNHEFDEGLAELTRLINGGNHPNGPFLEPKWRGARFPYVSANVRHTPSGRPVVPPYTIKFANGVRFGVIGAVLKETPTIVTPSGVAGLTFGDEAEAINAAVRELKKLRIATIVVTIHQGTAQPSFTGPTDPAVQNLTGPIIDIVRQLDDEVDVVISGHRHGFTNALVSNASGKPILLTQAFSSSTAYGDIDLALSRRSGDVAEKSASIVTTWADEGPGLVPDVRVAELVAAADQTVAPLVNRIVGVAATALTRAESPAGESALGNLIADAQRIESGAQLAFMNPGGIRADLDAGEVTWGELFTVQPFGNDLVSMDLTGAQIDLLLEQQWQGQPLGPRILKASGLTYTWDFARPIGDRVVEIRDAGGQLLDPAATYRVTVNSFMASGGDNFFVLVQGTNRVVGAVDLDALVAYVEGLAQPFSAAIEGRIQRLN